jgi:hypothetical protein
MKTQEKTPFVTKDWSKELVSILINEEPLDNEKVKELANTEPFKSAGKSAQAIRSKAASMKIYSCTEKGSNNSKSAEPKKIEYILKIEKALNLPKLSLATLEKSNKGEIILLFEKIEQLTQQ